MPQHFAHVLERHATPKQHGGARMPEHVGMEIVDACEPPDAADDPVRATVVQSPAMLRNEKRLGRDRVLP